MPGISCFLRDDGQIFHTYFCALGTGGELPERGETMSGGRLPVNPSGGLESKGHPIAAMGLRLARPTQGERS